MNVASASPSSCASCCKVHSTVSTTGTICRWSRPKSTPPSGAYLLLVCAIQWSCPVVLSHCALCVVRGGGVHLSVPVGHVMAVVRITTGKPASRVHCLYVAWYVVVGYRLTCCTYSAQKNCSSSQCSLASNCSICLTACQTIVVDGCPSKGSLDRLHAGLSLYP